MKEINDEQVKKTVDRSKLYRAQTPQGVLTDLYKKALLQIKSLENITDDSSIFEAVKIPVTIIPGRENFFKVTTTEDWNRFLSVVQTDKEGNRLNAVKVDGVDSTDEKVIGKRLQEIAKNATTGGLYKAVGELYGFPIKVVSERTLKEGLEFTDNRFVVEGNYKYTYNNGHLAMADPIAAARNFLNALERIPTIIDQYKSKNEVLEKEIPQLQEIAGKVWKKEDELKQLKSELAALDRKIQLELAPPDQENTEENRQGNEKKQTEQQPESPHVDFVRSHLIIGRPGLSESKGVKL